MTETTKYYLECRSSGLDMAGAATACIIGLKVMNPHLTHEETAALVSKELMQDLNPDGTIKTNTDKVYEERRS